MASENPLLLSPAQLNKQLSTPTLKKKLFTLEILKEGTLIFNAARNSFYAL